MGFDRMEKHPPREGTGKVGGGPVMQFLPGAGLLGCGTLGNKLLLYLLGHREKMGSTGGLG
jgi:hypothetical protein